MINQFELALGEILGGESKDYPAGAADKKGVRSGKLIFSHIHAYSALTDLGKLCEAANLSPQPPPKTKETLDLPPLGLDSMMVENAGRIATATANPTPIAFGQWIEPSTPSANTHAAPVSVTTPVKPIVVTRRQSAFVSPTSVPSPSPVTGTGTGTGAVVPRPSSSIGHRKTNSTMPEKGTLSHKKRASAN